jgi:NAD(P)-dependent dehydrogenase (short-subunit alcohol dehydrogenase family)
VDVAQPASVSGLAWQLDGEAIDIALYVAGVMSRASATEPPTQPEFDRVMHTNVLGAMQVIPQVAPLVAAASQGRGGRFVFLSSVMGQIGTVASSDCWLYRVSKAALNMAVAPPSPATPAPRWWPAPRLGADRHGRRRRAVGRDGQRARHAPPWPP